MARAITHIIAIHILFSSAVTILGHTFIKFSSHYFDGVKQNLQRRAKFLDQSRFHTKHVSHMAQVL